MRAELTAILMTVAACTPGTPAAPAVSPSDYDGSEALNPRLADGRLVYRGFDDHHPDCFAFVETNATSGDTESVECPAAAIEMLGACPAGKLHRAYAGGCVCVPLGEEPAERVECP